MYTRRAERTCGEICLGAADVAVGEDGDGRGPLFLSSALGCVRGGVDTHATQVVAKTQRK